MRDERPWCGGRFTGAVSEDQAANFNQVAMRCTGPAGAVCLMHARVAHVNASSAPRTLFIVTCAAADAVPLSPVAVPSRHAGRMVRGMDTGRTRSAALQVEVPEVPKTASFLARQAGEG